MLLRGLHLGLWLFLREPVLPAEAPWPARGGRRDRSLLAHTRLAGMQHHLKEEGQLLQGHVHHFSWGQAGKKLAVAASGRACPSPSGLQEGGRGLSEWLGHGECQQHRRDSQAGLAS